MRSIVLHGTRFEHRQPLQDIADPSPFQVTLTGYAVLECLVHLEKYM